MKKLQINDVIKKDLKVVFYLLVFALTTILTEKITSNQNLSLMFGGVANYVLYRINQELANEGYTRFLKK